MAHVLIKSGGQKGVLAKCVPTYLQSHQKGSVTSLV